jgi:hypothetical protein
MAAKALQHRMMDYVAQRLTDGGHVVQQRARDLLGQLSPSRTGIESHYLLLGKDKPYEGIVVLVDRHYTGKRFKTLRRWLSTEFPQAGFVFLKDGKTYFRNAAAHHDFKRKYELSLKQYRSEQTHRMITFRPEERQILDASCRTRTPHRIQYYQPNSDRLEEALVTYVFGTVTFDYSHITSDRFQPQDKESERIFIWEKSANHTGPLRLVDGLLRPLETQAQTG